MKLSNTPTLYILIGYPGSGKTTTAQTLQRLTGAVHIWTDMERKTRFDSVTHSREESKLLYGALNKEVSELLKAGKSVIFDTNFNHRSDRDHMRAIAAEASAELMLLWVHTDTELARERATKKSANNPTRVFGNMEEDIFNSIVSRLEPPTADEPYIEVNGTKVSDEYLRDLLAASN